jgi:hypothetical protein
MRLNYSQRKSLSTEKQSCVRHHFGVMRPDIENNEIDVVSPALSLFLKPSSDQEESSLLFVETLDSDRPFCPNICFDLPSKDEMLHFICIRDGVYYNHKRISTSYGLKTIYSDRNNKQMYMFGNSNQASCSGKFLESEIISAIIVSLHSHDTLSGCPLPVFLQALVAELNVNEEYTPQGHFPLSGVPALYERVTVGLLSPANTSWQADSTSKLVRVQNDTILLDNCEWSAI